MKHFDIFVKMLYRAEDELKYKLIDDKDDEYLKGMLDGIKIAVTLLDAWREEIPPTLTFEPNEDKEIGEQ